MNDTPAPIRVADLRFVLPAPVQTAVVVGAPRWSEALEAAGVALTAAPDPDLCVAPTAQVAVAAAPRARQVVVLRSRGRSELARAGFSTARVLSWGDLDGLPRLVVRLDHRRALRYSLEIVLARPQRWRRVRNRCIAAVAPWTGLPGRTLLVGVRDEWVPFPVESLQIAALPSVGEWSLQLGSGDELQRAVLLVFGNRDMPVVAAKVARVPGPVASASMDRDRRALHLVHKVAPRAARHAPTFLGRFDRAGHAISVESAAPGRPLNEVLAGRGARRRLGALIDRVAAWVVDLAAESAQPHSLGPELRRLREEVVPAFSHPALGAHLFRGLELLPGVLQHNDLGTWNIVTTGSDFVVVDWESTARSGLPLWDLVYLLTDALVLLDGPRPVQDRVAAALALLRGEHRESARLFDWIDTARTRLGVPAQLVGPIVTLGWLHHGLSHHRRAESLREVGAGPIDQLPARIGTVPRLAQPWLADRLLGPEWAAWGQRS